MAALDASGIEYLVIGGVAYGLYVEPRFTKDMDVLVHVDKSSVAVLYDALREFGAPVRFLSGPSDFLQDDFVFFFGAPPWRIDILTSVPGVDFESAFADRVLTEFSGQMVSVISREWLIRAKRASGRPQDLVDVENLERFTPDRPSNP